MYFFAKNAKIPSKLTENAEEKNNFQVAVFTFMNFSVKSNANKVASFNLTNCLLKFNRQFVKLNDATVKSKENEVA